MKLTQEEVELLNSKIGMRYLLADKKLQPEKALKQTRQELELRALQYQMIKLQEWVIRERKKMVVLFEGRDAAGKGGAIRRLTARINPRHFRIVALDKPSEDERGQMYFQRYAVELPNPGEIVFFDRSWYNRAVVEPVNDFCTQHEYRVFMGQVNEFERMIVESDTFLLKIYLSISKEEQARRFREIKRSPLKRWKLTPVDARAQELWDVYTEYKDRMFDVTDTDIAPWKVIIADKKSEARLEVIRYVLDCIPYTTLKHEVPEE
ncbi:MAG: polyphosphate kinase 2 [Saprospirales bacterium]|nr:MAG: polyphosphate kinase 2 [Saprospirales bacterium]